MNQLDDKWERFGLSWHGCMDGLTGKILWLSVWWTNTNPKFVCAQYLKAVRTVGGKFLAFLQFYCGWYLIDIRCAVRHPE